MASNTAGETPEIAALRQNLGMLNETISGNLQWFSNELVEKAFITQGQAGNILGIHGIGPAEKASKLLDSVFTVLRHTDERKIWFDKFVAILSPEGAYVDLINKLKRSHASVNSDTQAAVVDDNLGECAIV